MSKIHLQDPANFSETFLDEYCKNGLWDQVPKLL
jgi:hypothetical protein